MSWVSWGHAHRPIYMHACIYSNYVVAICLQCVMWVMKLKLYLVGWFPCTGSVVYQFGYKVYNYIVNVHLSTITSHTQGRIRFISLTWFKALINDYDECIIIINIKYFLSYSNVEATVKVSHTFYPRLGLMLRSLVCITRTMPSYQLSRKKEYEMCSRLVTSYHESWISYYANRLYCGSPDTSELGEGNVAYHFVYIILHNLLYGRLQDTSSRSMLMYFWHSWYFSILQHQSCSAWEVFYGPVHRQIWGGHGGSMPLQTYPLPPTIRAQQHPLSLNFIVFMLYNAL